jgi:hypothetical protein
MTLNKPAGNMYDFVTHTWNTVKGKCLHNCKYCYVKSIANRFRRSQLPACFDERELKTNLGSGNFIFVGSSNDMFAKDIPLEWVFQTLDYCDKFQNKYLFQSKNPNGFYRLLIHPVAKKSVLCTTIESDIFHAQFMGKTPKPLHRSFEMADIGEFYPDVEKYITIEPVMDFSLERFVKMIRRCNPKQVNIGADTGRNNLPEPSREKVLELIAALKEFTVVNQKSNLNRISKSQQTCENSKNISPAYQRHA